MKRIIKLIVTIAVYILILLYFSITFLKKAPTTNVCELFETRLNDEIKNYFVSLDDENEETLKVTVDELISEGFLTLEDFDGVKRACSGAAYMTKVGENHYYYNDITCGKCSTDQLYTAWSGWEETLPNFGDKEYQIMTKTLYNYSSSQEKWTDWSEWGESIEKITSPSIPTGVEVVNTETEEKKQYRYRTGTYKWYKLSSNVEYYNGNNYYSETAPSGYKRLESSKRVVRITKMYLTEEELRKKENMKTGDEIKAVVAYRVRTAKYIYSNISSSASSSTYQVPGVATSQSSAISVCKNQQPQWASTCVSYCSTSNGSTCTKYGYKYTVTPNYLTSNGTITTNKANADYLSEAEFNNLKKSNSSLSSYVKVGNPIYIYQTTEYTEGECPSGLTCGTGVLYKGIIYEYRWFKTVNSNKTMCNNGLQSATSPETGCIKDSSSVVWSDWSEFSDTEVKKTDTNEVEIKTLIRYRKSYISSNDLVMNDWYTYEDFESKTGQRIEDLKADKNVNLQEKIMYKYRILK